MARHVFVLQFVWFLAAWSAVAVLLIRPRLESLDHCERLTVWTAPQLFRALGTGLLAPNLSPGMPMGFALPTAISDGTTALLALFAVAALVRRWRRAMLLTWACHLVGLLDLVVAVPHAAAIDASQYLHAQWYVPALVLPLMLVAHVMALQELRRGG